ncbi:hypothetical protein DEM27_33180 [Metarhizobium album]|uniref:PLD phosphodiesterase domain-containing protein n=1 Tax=Metarhizobium album TaxID=2182425 RepID=A0A2U2DFI4_9HYPH|nr:hypothetical protein DEM27_33180 [Rhizobium album]
MAGEFQVNGKSASSLFSLRVHRGEGMALVAMNWRGGPPPPDFVGFAIEYRPPGGTRFLAVSNRIAFPDQDGAGNPNKLSSRLSPIQKFRWVHFPFDAKKSGEYTYMVTPVFMDVARRLSYEEPQTADIELRREGGAGIGVDGVRRRRAINETLDEAIADPSARVYVVACDFSERGFVDRLRQLGGRLKIIIDDDGKHGAAHSGETRSADILIASAGAENVKRQHMGKLQHNKMIVVDGDRVKKAVGGSTNFSWRGFYVQSNGRNSCSSTPIKTSSCQAPFTKAASRSLPSMTKPHFS